MTIPPLCIIQARLHSTRLANKMLLPLGGETLIARAWRIACSAFGEYNCVVAIPASDAIGPLADELTRVGATWVRYLGDEADVLGRFHHVAHTYRWHPDSVIVRYTPDDVFKDPYSLIRVASGARLPVEVGGEAFTLAMLDAAFASYGNRSVRDGLGRGLFDREREHLTHALFTVAPPPAPDGCWTVDTEADYETALARLEEEADGMERALWHEPVTL